VYAGVWPPLPPPVRPPADGVVVFDLVWPINAARHTRQSRLSHKEKKGSVMMMRRPSTHDQGAVGVIAVGSVDDEGSGSESGDGDENGDGIGGGGDMTGDGGDGDGGRRGELDWCVLGVAVVANIWEACPENP
jgi:hypothetical protein